MQGWPGFLTLIGFAANVTVGSTGEHMLRVGVLDRLLDVFNCSLVNRARMPLRLRVSNCDERGIAQCCSCHLVSLVCHAIPLCSEAHGGRFVGLDETSDDDMRDEFNYRNQSEK